MQEMYHDLEMWQRANSLCLRVHKLSQELPLRERTNLFKKLRDNSEQVPLYIAQGSSSISINEYSEYLKESYRILIKLKTEILIVRHLRYISGETLKNLDDDINELITLLLDMINSLTIKNQALHPSFAYWFPAMQLN